MLAAFNLLKWLFFFLEIIFHSTYQVYMVCFKLSFSFIMLHLSTIHFLLKMVYSLDFKPFEKVAGTAYVH